MAKQLVLTERERDFMVRVKNGDKLRLADREEDKVRQRLKRLGLVEVVMNPRRWVITIKGVSYFASDAYGLTRPTP